MNPSELDKFLKFLLETLQSTKDFTVEQAPLFVQELLRWRLYEAAFFAVLGAVAVALGWAIGRTYYNNLDEDDTDRTPLLWWWRIGGSVIGGAMIAANIHTMIYIKVAPRVYMVQMVRDLLVGTK